MVKKILLTFGTRPEAIKLAPLIHALKRQPEFFDVIVCATGQHREMLDQVNLTFGIVPDFDLKVMKPGQDLFDITSNVLIGMRDIISQTMPDILIVHGDTTTTFAAAIAAFYKNVFVAHVEAGLRTYNLQAPFPEEFNRQVVTKLSRWNFAPSEGSRNNLLAEGIKAESIIVTGNTVIDSLFLVLDRINGDDARKQQLQAQLSTILNFDFRVSTFILITAHRRENFGEGIIHLAEALLNLSARYPDVHFVYPVHRNPNIFEPVTKRLAGIDNIHLIQPLDYEAFLYLLKYCKFVLTDSGGLQEEAPSLGKPVLVLRDETERPEAVSAGTARLLGTNTEKIIANCIDLIENELSYIDMTTRVNPYGDGTASEKIVNVLRDCVL
jgi:UDP-N-acetylglucosamine 2-epimerase (non-hydrolysing)